MNQFDIEERQSSRQPRLSEGRKTAYYVGTGIAVFGLLMFLSVFVTSAMNFGNFDNFTGRARSSGLRAIFGMIMMMAGQAIRAVGARGFAGSGVVLNPEQARDDLHPYTNAAGGMVRDVLDGAQVNRDSAEPGNDQVILIRCTQCRKLNEETDKFCSECGSSMR